MVRFILLICLTSRLTFAEETEEEMPHHRTKRYLLFPFRGTFKTVYSFAIPWKLGPKQEMGVGWNFQFLYDLPYNTTSITNWPTVTRGARDKRESETDGVSDRALFYTEVEGLLNRNGFNGRDCILKTICQNAEYSNSYEESGMLGQVLNVFLTPNYGDDDPDPYLDIEYSDAQKAGEYGADCETLYTGCNMEKDFFDLFSLNKDII